MRAWLTQRPHMCHAAPRADVRPLCGSGTRRVGCVQGAALRAARLRRSTVAVKVNQSSQTSLRLVRGDLGGTLPHSPRVPPRFPAALPYPSEPGPRPRCAGHTRWRYRHEARERGTVTTQAETGEGLAGGLQVPVDSSAWRARRSTGRGSSRMCPWRATSRPARVGAAPPRRAAPSR